MRVVIYAMDFEPITIVELPGFAIDHIEKYGRVSIPVQSSPSLVPSIGHIDDVPFKVVRIQAEKFRYHNYVQFMLFTPDEESAMLLKASFLPGQQATLQQRELNAFAAGFLAAIQRLGA